MALKSYQTAVQLGKLYEVKVKGGVQGSEQLVPNIFLNDGTVDIYGSNSATEPTALTDMILNTENTGVSGIVAFSVIPRYIAIVQNGGTTSELVITGLEVNYIKDIS